MRPLSSFRFIALLLLVCFSALFPTQQIAVAKGGPLPPEPPTSNAPALVYLHGGGVYVLKLEDKAISVRRGPQLISRFSIASLTSPLIINGLDGVDETLRIDFQEGNPIPASGLIFNAGLGDRDIIELINGQANRVVYEFYSETSGAIEVDGRKLIYQGLEPIVDNLNTADRVLEFTSGAETITLSDDAASTAGQTYIDSTAGENLTFTNPTSSLTINTSTVGGTAGTDTILIEGVDPDWDADLIINADADDSAYFQTNPLDLGASGALSVTAGSGIYIGQNITTGDGQTFVDNVILTSDVTLSDSGTLGIQLESTVDSDGTPRNLSIETSNTISEVDFDAAVGGNSPLKNITITNAGLIHSLAAADFNLTGNFLQNGSGTVRQASDITTAGGNIEYQGPLYLNANVTLDTSSSGGNITFGNTINDDGAVSNRTLTISAGTGNVTFNGVVGGIVDPDFININNADTVTANEELGAATAINIYASTIAFNADITGTCNLSLSPTNTSTFTSGATFSYLGETTFNTGTNYINGTLSAGGGSVWVTGSGTTLAGTGSLNRPTTVMNGSSLAPGNTPGIFHTGDITFTVGSTLNVEIGGTTPGSGASYYDQLDVTGSVNIDPSAILNLASYGGFTPSPGQTFTIINNDGTDPITGNFNGLPEGAIINDFLGSGLLAIITYQGGDGNDIVISVTSVSVTVSPSQTNEDGTSVLTYTFTRSDTITDSLTVNFLVGGTAKYNTDYTVSGADSFTSTNGQVTIPSGSNTSSILIAPTDDTVVELDETVIITVTAGTNYNAGSPSQATGTIINDDQATIDLVGESRAEGDSGGTKYTFTATLDSAVDVGVTVDYATVDDTATVADSDYITQTGSISFLGNAGEQHTITVTVNGDYKVEADEIFDLSLSNIQAQGRDVVFSSGNPTLNTSATILNDDAATVTLSGGGSKLEGDSGAVSYVFTATLDNPVQGGFDLNYTTNDDSATLADGDYIDNDGLLSFSGAAGESHTITVLANGDAKVEPDEAFNVALGPFANTALAADLSAAGSPQSGVILNDDADIIAGADQIVDENETVRLDPATFTDPDNPDPHTATIDWGDGTPIENGVVNQTGDQGAIAGEHTYLDNGRFTVTVCITGAISGTTCDTFETTVNNVNPVLYPITDQVAYEGNEFTFVAHFNDVGTLDTHTANIDWGDGTVVDPLPLTEPTLTSSGVITLTHTYLIDGLYTAQICVKDKDGGENCLAFDTEVQPVWRFRGTVEQAEANALRSNSVNGLPVAGATLHLFGRNFGEAAPGELIKTEVTDIDGFFNFFILSPWLYDIMRLEITPPEGMAIQEITSPSGVVVDANAVEWTTPPSVVLRSQILLTEATPTPTPTPTPNKFYLPLLLH